MTSSTHEQLLKVGDTVQLLSDVISNMKAKKIYARRNETAKIISSSHWPVLIVEGPIERYPVRCENVILKKT